MWVSGFAPFSAHCSPQLGLLSSAAQPSSTQEWRPAGLKPECAQAPDPQPVPWRMYGGEEPPPSSPDRPLTCPSPLSPPGEHRPNPQAGRGQWSAPSLFLGCCACAPPSRCSQGQTAPPRLQQLLSQALVILSGRHAGVFPKWGRLLQFQYCG